MDLEAESIITIDTGMSTDIAESCNKLLETQKKILTTEEELKKLKEVETTLSEQTIPNLMQQAGVSLLKLADGTAVEVKPFYSARIPASKSDEAFNWLRENGHGDLIKNQVSLEFGMKQDNEAKSIIEELKAKGLPVKQKTTVHPSSLRGFVREQIQDLGKDVPAELFGTYVANKTKITTKEQS
jgi:3-dehydroquinate synthetase|tara:strand:+ start:629 stop:1180 length:552 start_codon:yes stop_codon:yes gene_type:complete